MDSADERPDLQTQSIPVSDLSKTYRAMYYKRYETVDEPEQPRPLQESDSYYNGGWGPDFEDRWFANQITKRAHAVRLAVANDNLSPHILDIEAAALARVRQERVAVQRWRHQRNAARMSDELQRLEVELARCKRKGEAPGIETFRNYNVMVEKLRLWMRRIWREDEEADRMERSVRPIFQDLQAGGRPEAEMRTPKEAPQHGEAAGTGGDAVNDSSSPSASETSKSVA